MRITHKDVAIDGEGFIHEGKTYMVKNFSETHTCYRCAFFSQPCKCATAQCLSHQRAVDRKSVIFVEVKDE